jgi:perosamine synthetase
MSAIHLFRPVISENAISAVADVLRSGWTGLGPRVQDFEKMFADYVGAKYCVALNSCTSALHLALRLLNIKEGDEIITTALTFISTNHVILYERAIPIFADVQLDTGCIDPTDIEKKITEKTKAIMVMHYGGLPSDLDELHAIAKTYNVAIIEDAAHAMGALYKGKKIGSISSINCFSQQSVKNLSIGDSGCITTDNRLYRDRLIKLRWLGIDKGTFQRTEMSGSTLAPSAYSWLYQVEEVGYKYHLNDILAAIGIEQLKLLDQENARRKEIVDIYTKEFECVPGVVMLKKPIDRVSSNHLFVLRVERRNLLIDKLKQHDIHCGVHYRLSTNYPMYQKVSLPNAEKLESELISLPLHLSLTDEDVQRVIETIKKGW